ncbi:MAG: S41 family peptidase [Bacteroidia bacterium]
MFLWVFMFLFGKQELFSQATINPEFASEYQAICDTVEKYFYRSDIIEKTFIQEREKYHSRLSEVKTQEAFSQLVNDLLAELNTSHTNYYTRNDLEYYHLAGIFYSLPWIKALFPGEDSIAYPSLGMLTQKINQKIFVIGVLEDGPGEKAGLKKGDEILGFREFAWGNMDTLKKWTDQTVHLRIRRTKKGRVQEIPIIPRMVNPQQEFLRAVQNSVSVIEKERIKIGYIHLWSYAGTIFQDELKAAISWGSLKDADVLIWDLRDGWGGASPEYLNVFNNQIPQLSFTDREGNTRYFDSQWRKPVVMLINQGSRSGKELLAYGFKKYEIGPIVGETTAGAVVAGRLFVMPSGNLLYLAVNNAMVDGEVLEGKGVSPTISVPMRIPYLEGKDIQLEKAIETAVKLRP